MIVYIINRVDSGEIELVTANENVAKEWEEIKDVFGEQVYKYSAWVVNDY